MVWSHFREVNFNLRIMDRMLGILKVKMSLEYPTFETAFESGLGGEHVCMSKGLHALAFIAFFLGLVILQ